MRSEAAEQVWRERLARALRSGMPVRKFCEGEGITEQRYYYWKKRLGADDASPRFVEIQRHVVESAPFELLLPGGLVVRVPFHFDENELSRLLKVVMPS